MEYAAVYTAARQEAYQIHRESGRGCYGSTNYLNETKQTLHDCTGVYDVRKANFLSKCMFFVFLPNRENTGKKCKPQRPHTNNKRTCCLGYCPTDAFFEVYDSDQGVLLSFVQVELLDKLSHSVALERMLLLQSQVVISVQIF